MADLQIDELAPGEGQEAKAGDRVTVHPGKPLKIDVPKLQPRPEPHHPAPRATGPLRLVSRAYLPPTRSLPPVPLGRPARPAGCGWR